MAKSLCFVSVKLPVSNTHTRPPDRPSNGFPATALTMQPGGVVLPSGSFQSARDGTLGRPSQPHWGRCEGEVHVPSACRDGEGPAAMECPSSPTCQTVAKALRKRWHGALGEAVARMVPQLRGTQPQEPSCGCPWRPPPYTSACHQLYFKHHCKHPPNKCKQPSE